MVVVPGRAGVAGAVALAAGFHPDEGVLELQPRVGCRPGAEAGAQGVAPVAPRGLAGRLLAGAALVGDEVGVEAGRGQERRDGLDV